MAGKKNWYSTLSIPGLPSCVCLCIISLLALLCFHSSVNGGFVFDDTEAVVNNEDIRLLTPLSNMFHNDFWGTHITHNASHKSYRPLTILSFRLNVLAAGGELNAYQFHIVNLILYVAVCCLSYFVFMSLLGGASCQGVAFTAAVLFTVHPVHTEAVAPVVGRADLLCALFMFSAFMVYICALDSKTNVAVKVLCTILTIMFAAVSMFAKEQGITVLAICCAYDVLILHKLHPTKIFLQKTWALPKIKSLVYRQVILVIAAFSLLLLRWWIMGGTVPVFKKVDNPASFMDSMHLRAAVDGSRLYSGSIFASYKHIFSSGVCGS